MSDMDKLAFAMLEFLETQMKSPSISDDSAESLEVAAQCLETAFGISATDEITKSTLSTGYPLIEIFKAGLEKLPPPPPEAPTVQTPPMSEEDRARANQLKNEGNNLMKEERHEEAVESYSQAIAIDSNNAVYFCNRAAAFNKLDNHQKALEDCRLAISIDPNYGKAYGRMGLAYSNLNDHQRALEAYRKAVNLDPGNASYIANLQVTEQKLREINLQANGGGGANANPFSRLPSMPSGMDFGTLLNNPDFMNMASSLMQNPQMQHMMQNMMMGAAGGGGPGVPATPPGMADLLFQGQRMAQQVERENPDLVAHLRQQMANNEGAPSPQEGPSNPPPPPDNGKEGEEE